MPDKTMNEIEIEMMEKIRKTLVTTKYENVEFVKYKKDEFGYIHAKVLFSGGIVFVNELKELNVSFIKAVSRNKIMLTLWFKEAQP